MGPTFHIAALSAVIALSAAAGARAQDEHRGPAPQAGQMQARMQQMREAHERQRAQDLRTILRLRPDQEPALTAFLQSHKPPQGAGMRDHRGPPGEAGPMTTPQQLDAMARREADHAAMQRRHADALRAFYAALNAEQRQVFDALQRVEHAGRGHGGWGHRGFGGMGGQWGGPPAGGLSPRD
jgi:protein CpxP